MIYNVFGGTLNLAQSINQQNVFVSDSQLHIKVYSNK